MAKMPYNPDQKAAVDAILSALPEVKEGKAFGYPAYKVRGKVFAFVGSRGVAIKLPAPKVQSLIKDGAPYYPFEPGRGIIWKEWVSIQREDAQTYHEDEDLLVKSMEFVMDNT